MARLSACNFDKLYGIFEYVNSQGGVPLKLRYISLVCVTVLLVALYIWGFYFFRSPEQVFRDYEQAILDYAYQMKLQEEAGLKVGLNVKQLTDIKEVAIIDLEGDMKRIIANFSKDWLAMKRVYLEYTKKSGSWFDEGLSGTIVTRSNPEYFELLSVFNLVDDPDRYCLLFIPNSNASGVFQEFLGARLYYLQRTLWGYRIEWSRSLIDLLLGMDPSSISV
jgi:hypothetical protein